MGAFENYPRNESARKIEDLYEIILTECAQFKVTGNKSVCRLKRPATSQLENVANCLHTHH